MVVCFEEQIKSYLIEKDMKLKTLEHIAPSRWIIRHLR